MSKVRQLHDEAMKLAQLALIARQKGQLKEAENIARQAYQYEQQAAQLIPIDEQSEPTRSILYRSAASLAYQCHEHAQAYKLIKEGLAGYPPPQIKQELQTLATEISAHQQAPRSLTIEGVMDYAESRQHNVIGVTTEDNQAYYILVQDDITDLVRRYFYKQIMVSGHYDGQYIHSTAVQVV
ncbi:hypothetical protein QUF64_05365 [Anaerolineales bacterium HSG6]|nr:hypothetical protein [Anaerolineales bacterium HSG6]